MTSGEFQPQPGPYGELGGYPPPSGGQEPGGLGLRFAARLIDGIIVAVVSWILIFATNTMSNYWVTGLFTGLLTFLYFLAFETTQGWTPGKKILGLSVHGPAGAPKPTVQQSAIRNVWTLLPIIPFIGGLLGVIAIVVIAVTINSSPTKQGKHDELAGGTQVVKG
jgi:uncharacterized RDD family membrane protein YckC